MKKSTRLSFWVACMLLFAPKIWAQTTVVHGKVTNQSDGQPLAGAYVNVNGQSKGTVTNDSGYFSIQIPAMGSSLTVNGAGKIAQTVTVNTPDSLFIHLLDAANDLNEVVVIGYGTQKKANVTGAISTVKAADLENQPVMRIEQSLQGRTSGLTIAGSSGQPGAASTVRIRGVTSINNSDPLYVVDGVPVDVGGIDFLDQNDIESIQVLKDAASAAIYGTRAASGVILVTTKQGKKGKMRTQYNGYYGLQRPDKKLKLLNATQYATLLNESYTNDGKPAVFNDPASYGAGTDWQSVIFDNNAPIQDHQISFSGGNDKSSFFSSLGYYDQKGIVLPEISWYKRFSLRINATHKMTNWLTFGENLSYAYIKSQGIGNVNNEFGGPLSSAVNLDPITPLIVTDPNIANQPPYSTNATSIVRDADGNPYGISTLVENEMTNPAAYAKTRAGNYNWSHNIVGNAYLEIEPIQGLKFRSTLGAKQAFYGSDNFSPIYYLNTIQKNGTPIFNRDNEQSLMWNFDNTLSYAFHIKNHSITAMVGTSEQEQSGFGVNGKFTGFPVNDASQASPNFALPPADKLAGGSDVQPYKLASFFGRVTYDYLGRYLLTGIVRRDGSSKFGENYQFGTFPSISAGWVPSNEKFWSSTNPISYLKIRASYGVNGNDNSLVSFQYLATVGSGASYPIGADNSIAIGYLPNALPNPNLKWEQSKQTDFGFDANFLQNFNFTFDWFNKVTSGMLLQIQLPGYLGAAANPYGNIADLRNRGIEMELGYNNKIGDVQFKVNANASYVKNVITNLGTNSYLTGATVQSSSYEISRTQVGQPLGAFYGFVENGIFQNQAQIDAYVNKDGNKLQPNAKPGDFIWSDLNNDGVISDKDRTFLGNPTPTWTYGGNISASWKGFDLAVFLQGAAGNKVFQALRRLDIARANWTTAALDRWTGEGTSNDYPRLTQADPNQNFKNPSSFYLSDASYLRIKNAQIGYTLPNQWIKKAGFERIRVYFSVNNLATFTKYAGYDPEIGGGNSTYGIDRGVYPQARSFIFGANIGL